MRLYVGMLAAVILGASLFEALLPPSAAPSSENAASHSRMQIRIGERVPPMLFEDQRGQPFLLQALRGETVILAFVCTRCRDAARCAGISGKFAYLQHRLPRGIRLVEITFDPARDTSDVLAAYAGRFGADPERWTFATDPDIASVLHFVAAFGVHRPGATQHASRIAVIDPHGRIADILDEDVTEPHDVLESARAAAGLSVTPIVRLQIAWRRVHALPPRVQHALQSSAFAAPVALFLISLVLRSMLIGSMRTSLDKHDWEERSRVERTC